MYSVSVLDTFLQQLIKRFIKFLQRKPVVYFTAIPKENHIFESSLFLFYQTVTIDRDNAYKIFYRPLVISVILWHNDVDYEAVKEISHESI